MPFFNRKGTTGGRGNEDKFTDRDSGVCAAGIPSTQESPVSECLQQYTLQHEVDALLHDTIFPPMKPKEPSLLRKSTEKDMRFVGLRTEIADLINPQIKSKFEQLAEDFKETLYASYWKKQVGKGPDHVPFLPTGLNKETTTFGKKLQYDGPIDEILFPMVPLAEESPKTKAGSQINRNYCSPPFDKHKTYGQRYGIPDTGIFAKCAFSDYTHPYLPLNSIQTNYKGRTQAKLGKVLAPNNNIANVTWGHSFGVLTKPDSLIECLTSCPLNPEYTKFKECLSHLNGVRKNLSKRVLPSFFHDFYLQLRYLDKQRTGCLPKEVVYDEAIKKMLRFDGNLLEPLLVMWNAFDGSLIKYKTFLNVINYKQPLPDLIKVPDIPQEFIDFRTTYTEMMKPCQEVDTRLRAGVPSARYFEFDNPKLPSGGCAADLCLLSDELTTKACLSPSIMTQYFVNHRDLYCVREPNELRLIFKRAHVEFTDEVFEKLWNNSKKYHSQGLVCIESFRKSILDNPELLKADNCK